MSAEVPIEFSESELFRFGSERVSEEDNYWTLIIFHH